MDFESVCSCTLEDWDSPVDYGSLAIKGRAEMVKLKKMQVGISEYIIIVLLQRI